LSDGRKRGFGGPAMRGKNTFVKLLFGNFGDVKHLGDGIWEARIDWGPGYRVYYADRGQENHLASNWWG